MRVLTSDWSGQHPACNFQASPGQSCWCVAVAACAEGRGDRERAGDLQADAHLQRSGGHLPEGALLLLAWREARRFGDKRAHEHGGGSAPPGTLLWALIQQAGP
jgi:hypothetical protein